MGAFMQACCFCLRQPGESMEKKKKEADEDIAFFYVTTEGSEDDTWGGT